MTDVLITASGILIAVLVIIALAPMSAMPPRDRWIVRACRVVCVGLIVAAVVMGGMR